MPLVLLINEAIKGQNYKPWNWNVHYSLWM